MIPLKPRFTEYLMKERCCLGFYSHPLDIFKKLKDIFVIGRLVLWHVRHVWVRERRYFLKSLGVWGRVRHIWVRVCRYFLRSQGVLGRVRHVWVRVQRSAGAIATVSLSRW